MKVQITSNLVPLHVRGLVAFESGSIRGVWLKEGTVYVVYSYGVHWPLLLYTPMNGWIGNDTIHPQPTTRRHRELAEAQLNITKRMDVISLGFRIQALTEPARANPPPTIEKIVAVTRKQLELFDIST